MKRTKFTLVPRNSSKYVGQPLKREVSTSKTNQPWPSKVDPHRGSSVLLETWRNPVTSSPQRRKLRPPKYPHLDSYKKAYIGYSDSTLGLQGEYATVHGLPSQRMVEVHAQWVNPPSAPEWHNSLPTRCHLYKHGFGRPCRGKFFTQIASFPTVAILFFKFGAKYLTPFDCECLA